MKSERHELLLEKEKNADYWNDYFLFGSKFSTENNKGIQIAIDSAVTDILVLYVMLAVCSDQNASCREIWNLVYSNEIGNLVRNASDAPLVTRIKTNLDEKIDEKDRSYP